MELDFHDALNCCRLGAYMKHLSTMILKKNLFSKNRSYFLTAILVLDWLVIIKNWDLLAYP